MANEYTLTLKSVTTLTSDTSKIDKVQVNVQNSTPAAVTGLLQDDFQLSDSGGTLVFDTDYTFSEIGSGDYEIDFKDGQELANTEYLIMKVDDETNISDRLFIDFMETFDASGQGTFQYNLTTAGDYKFVLDSADGTALGKESSTYTFINPPDSTNSSIAPVLDKPYLVQVIPGGGLDVSLQVTLKDANDVALDGASEVSLYADYINA